MEFGRAHSAWCHSICQAIFTDISPLYRIFKTPGLRTPAARERIYNVSVNGSPLADSKEIFLTVPVGGGEVSVPGRGGSGHRELLTHHFFCPSPISLPEPKFLWLPGSSSPHFCRTQNHFLSQGRAPDWEDSCPVLRSICLSANIGPRIYLVLTADVEDIPALE